MHSDQWFKLSLQYHNTLHLFSDVDYCKVITCLNGGTCTNMPNGFQCACVEPFEGTVCDIGKP